MKIPNEYPKFIDESALIIVSGRENGVFYNAKKGIIEKVTEFGEREPKYSDREGFFMRLGGGRFLGSGSVYESKIKTVEKRFMSDFHKEFINYVNHNDIDQVYFFAPKFMHGYLCNEIPDKYHDIIKYQFDGNYQKEHPLKLLKKIGDEIEREHPGPVPVKKEARKILSRFKITNK